MSQKATPISDLQPQQAPQQPDMAQLDGLIQELEQNDHQQQQPQMPPQYYEQPPMMMPNQPLMMPPPMMQKAPQSTMERLLQELRDALVVAVVFVLVNFDPVSKALDGVLSKVSSNPMVLLVLKGVVAGLVFYAVKKLVLNQ